MHVITCPHQWRILLRRALPGQCEQLGDRLRAWSVTARIVQTSVFRQNPHLPDLHEHEGRQCVGTLDSIWLRSAPQTPVLPTVMDSRSPKRIGRSGRKAGYHRTYRHEGGDVEKRHYVV